MTIDKTYIVAKKKKKKNVNGSKSALSILIALPASTKRTPSRPKGVFGIGW